MQNRWRQKKSPLPFQIGRVVEGLGGVRGLGERERGRAMAKDCVTCSTRLARDCNKHSEPMPRLAFPGVILLKMTALLIPFPPPPPTSPTSCLSGSHPLCGYITSFFPPPLPPPGHPHSRAISLFNFFRSQHESRLEIGVVTMAIREYQ